MTVKKVPKFYLKDILFNKTKVEKLADDIGSVHMQFDTKNFARDVLKEFPKLELKQRISHIGKMLYKYLPKDYVEATEIILHALPEELDNTLTDGDFGEFIYAPYAEYIAVYGMDKKHLKRSLFMLEEISKRF